ncbi:alpha/beta fold hydrolase [Streptacidiphilus fuscans]|uniref:Alpha/beta fold hydrolase n=1 Tax=Streptacidiphilus fuscans TaxID=2789292 RepID=A0A931B5H2_9ACTN|nr:alpha/beta hydrolase [Streptacidiphilus fuscans]MBF9070556.1 alpha/beta fold hydrolase [Streptacidiphilus fuscans]
MTISYETEGAAEADALPLVLLHAGACDSRMWDPQWAALVRTGRRVVRCDFRGFGATPSADAPYREADDVLALMDGLGIERAVLVGSSNGGRVAQEVALDRPDRVAGLALFCAPVPGHQWLPELLAFGEREDALLEAGDLDAATELNVTTWLGPEADDTAKASLRTMQRRAFELQSGMTEYFAADPVERDLSKIEAPTLVVSGAHDFQDFRDSAARLAAELPDVRRVALPWAGHLPTMERPDEATRLLLDFLDAASGNAA